MGSKGNQGEGENWRLAGEMIDEMRSCAGKQVHIRRTESGDRDVVFIHGIPGSSKSWDQVVRVLPSSLRAIVPDLVGFGASERVSGLGDLHAEGQARVLKEALEAMGSRRPVLVGHDFGGPVALRMIMANPDSYSGLVLASTNAFSDATIPFPLSLVGLPLIGQIVEGLMFSRPSLMAMCRLAAKRGRVDTASSVGDKDQARAIREIFTGSLKNMEEHYRPIQEALPALAIPTLVVWGDRDMFFPLAQAHRTAVAIQGARLALIPGAGHFLPEEVPDEFVEFLADFCSGLPRA